MRVSIRVLLLAAVAAMALNVSPQAAGMADAASCVKIYKIYYDSPGSDLKSNTSLNGEWIQLKNTCTTAKSLAGYRVRDLLNHSYTFGTYTLKACGLVKIHTGSGTNTSTDRDQRSTAYIWNNDKDTLYLYSGTGALLRTCVYNGTAVDYKLC